MELKKSNITACMYCEGTVASSTCGGVAGAGRHWGRLQDDGVAAGGQSNRHLLVQDPTWSLGGGVGGVIKNKPLYITNNCLKNALP